MERGLPADTSAAARAVARSGSPVDHPDARFQGIGPATRHLGRRRIAGTTAEVDLVLCGKLGTTRTDAGSRERPNRPLGRQPAPAPVAAQAARGRAGLWSLDRSEAAQPAAGC